MHCRVAKQPKCKSKEETTFSIPICLSQTVWRCSGFVSSFEWHDWIRRHANSHCTLLLFPTRFVNCHFAAKIDWSLEELTARKHGHMRAQDILTKAPQGPKSSRNFSWRRRCAHFVCDFIGTRSIEDTSETNLFSPATLTVVSESGRIRELLLWSPTI